MTTTSLLDANVLIALVVEEHKHHGRAHAWLVGVRLFALCPVVEGALVRYLVRQGESHATIGAVLAGFADDERCRFWGDDVSYRDVDLSGVRGHRQVTDAYLVALAQARHARLVTFDRALAAAYPQVVDEITSSIE